MFLKFQRKLPKKKFSFTGFFGLLHTIAFSSVCTQRQMTIFRRRAKCKIIYALNMCIWNGIKAWSGITWMCRSITWLPCGFGLCWKITNYNFHLVLRYFILLGRVEKSWFSTFPELNRPDYVDSSVCRASTSRAGGHGLFHGSVISKTI